MSLAPKLLKDCNIHFLYQKNPYLKIRNKKKKKTNHTIFFLKKMEKLRLTQFHHFCNILLKFKNYKFSVSNFKKFAILQSHPPLEFSVTCSS
jgi:hypothetical protein